MTDLDKKVQKSQPDLVQSVLEAYEKRNQDRVDMLITNALVQLKGSRFKPDQSVFVGLSYLARLQPKVFSQSTNLKETLKNHVKRQGVPANIKGNKTDFFLPVLASNILLASCDSPDVRSTILTRIGHWISSSQKLHELVQHLLATLCIRCQSDPETIKTLMEMRNQWFDFLESNFSTYGKVSPDLARAIRTLLGSLTTCEALVENLNFLIKHDSNISGLCSAISKTMVEKPITFKNVLSDTEHSEKLIHIILNIFEGYFKRHSEDLKTITKTDDKTGSIIYFNFQQKSQVFALDSFMVDALLTLISGERSIEMEETPQLLTFLRDWLSTSKSSPNLHTCAFQDVSLTVPHLFPTGLLADMIGCENRLVRELVIYNASPAQLTELFLTFGQNSATIDELLERLETIKSNDVDFLLRDCIFLNELLDHYVEIGSKHVQKFRERLNNIELHDLDCKNMDVPVDIKIKREVS